MTNMNDFVFTRHYPLSVGLGLRGSTRYTGTLYLVGHCKKERIKLCVIMVPYFFPMFAKYLSVYVDMHENYVDMQNSYVSIKHNFVDMQESSN